MGVNQNLSEKFIEISKRRFNFIVSGYKWRVYDVNPDRSSGSEIVFMNGLDTFAIKLRLCWRENTFFSSFIKPVNGKIPAYPIFPKETDPVNWIYFDYLETLRSPDSKIQGFTKGQITEKEVESWLKQTADFLKAHATDLLSGDMTVTKDLDMAVKQNIVKVRELNRKR